LFPSLALFAEDPSYKEPLGKHPSTHTKMRFEIFGLLTAGFGVGASAAVLASRSPVHLAVSPNCGTLSDSPASVNAGLNDLSSYKTIIAFGVWFGRFARDYR